MNFGDVGGREADPLEVLEAGPLEDLIRTFIRTHCSYVFLGRGQGQGLADVVVYHATIVTSGHGALKKF